MKQVIRKIEITLAIFALLVSLSIVEMTLLNGKTKSESAMFSLDKYNTIFQNE